MKSYKYVFLLLALSWATTGCQKNFLDRMPKSQLSNETFWNSASDMEIYNNGIYDEAGNNAMYSFMVGYTNGPWPSGFDGTFWQDCQSDNVAPLNSMLNKYQTIASGQYIIPDNPQQGGWYWSLLRRINFFLENYQRATAPTDIKNAYAGEARMFRAWFYFDKVKRFGDVPWIDKTLNINSDKLYAPRDPRNIVMDSVLADINFAVANLPVQWGGGHPGRLNRWAALALKSRICLYEGTYRKYHHAGDDVDKWLQNAADAAAELINKGPYHLYSTGDPNNDYNMLFRQLDLSGNPEVIFFRKYVLSVNGMRLCGYISSRTTGMTRDFEQDYLCTDGNPIQISPLYQGDDDLGKELSNRDPRLRQTILYPSDSAKYLDIYKADYKYPRFPGMAGGRISSTGFTLIKFYDKAEDAKGYGKEENDAIIFRLGEVMLNFAEAKAELGTHSQSDLDISINKLRDRAGMPHLFLNPPMDPKYAGEGQSSILIEIRRERRVELALEGFRYDDLMRWAKGEYLTKKVLGMRFEDSQVPNFPGAQVKMAIVDGKKYIDVYQGSVFENRSFDPNKNYLFPIPIGVISMNPKIKQNPGW